MHGKIATDAMARAMVEIEPDFPQRRARQRIQLHTVCAGRKISHSERNMAAQNAGKGINSTGRCLAALNQNRARDICRALLILSATIDEIEVTRLNRAIGFLGHALMDNRAIGAGAGNRIEAQIKQFARGRTAGFGLFGSTNFRQLAFGGIFVEPSEEIT